MTPVHLSGTRERFEQKELGPFFLGTLSALVENADGPRSAWTQPEMTTCVSTQRVPFLQATDTVQKRGRAFHVHEEGRCTVQAHVLRLLKGRQGHYWEQRRQPAARAPGIRAGPYLAHVQHPALISLVYEAVDDEPGLPVCLKIRCLYR